MLNQVFKVHVNCLLMMLSKLVTFLDCWRSQGRVATHSRWGGNLCNVYDVYTEKIILRISWWQNFENWSTFAKVIIKHQGAYFFRTLGTGWTNKNRTFWDTMFFSANVDRFSKFFHQVIRKKILYHKYFHITCNMLLHYLVKVENPKMLLTLTAPQQTVETFLWTLMGTWFII